MADIILNDPEHLLAGGISEDNVATVILVNVSSVAFLQVSEDLSSMEYVVLSENIPESIKVYFDGEHASMNISGLGTFVSAKSENIEIDYLGNCYYATDKTAVADFTGGE